MRLKNKKTGEIVINQTMRGELNALGCNTLKDLQEWEEVGEYFINPFGMIFPLEYITEEDIEPLKEIGNYFETEEEAEKAVEKLKAWKRLKDKGFRFNRWKEAPLRTSSSCIAVTGNMKCDDEAREDLDLLFGGEE